MVASPELMRGLADVKDARESHGVADKYADGCAGEPFASARAARMMRKAGIDTLEEFRYAEIPIRTIAGGLAVLEPTVIGPDESVPAGEAGDVLAEIWRVNQLAEEINNRLWDDCSRYGEGFLFVWPVTESLSLSDTPGDELADEAAMAGEPVDPAENIVGVDVMVYSPWTVTAIYAEGNSTRLEYVIKQWVEGEGAESVNRATLYFDGLIQRWATAPGTKSAKPDSWILLAEEPHDSGQPFHHFRNRRPIGRPEHELGYGPQQMINKLVGTDATTIDFSAFPQRYYLADPKIDDPLQNLNNPDFPEDEDDDPEGTGSTSALEGDPASVWKLYARGAGQFDPPSPSVFIDRLNWYISAMAQLTGIPEHHFGRGTGSTPSAAALRTLEVPTNDIRAKRRESYGPVLVDTLEHALAILGYDGYRVQLRWKPATTITDSEGWQTITAMVALGVPFEAAVQQAGFTPEQAADWSNGADGTDLGRRLTLLQGVIAVVPALLDLAKQGAFDPPELAPPPPPELLPPGPPADTGEVDPVTGEPIDPATGQPAGPVPPPPPVQAEPVGYSKESQEIVDGALALLRQALSGVEEPDTESG